MTTQEFEAHVLSHVVGDLDLNYAIIAMNEEAGECAGWYKKVVLRNNPKGLTDEDLKGELGDLLYYLTRAAQVKGWSLSDVMDYNKVKLDARKATGMKLIA